MNTNDRYLFSGKRLDNGEWVFGSLIHEPVTSSNKYSIYCRGEQAPYSLGQPLIGIGKHKVDPSTVGQFTGLKDKNGVMGFFGINIWQVTDFEYSVKSSSGGYYSYKTTLRFIITEPSPFEIGYQLVAPPNGLEHISLRVIFNLENSNGKRIFRDDYRQRLEIVGNRFDNPELLATSPNEIPNT